MALLVATVAITSVLEMLALSTTTSATSSSFVTQPTEVHISKLSGASETFHLDTKTGTLSELKNLYLESIGKREVPGYSVEFTKGTGDKVLKLNNMSELQHGDTINAVLKYDAYSIMRARSEDVIKFFKRVLNSMEDGRRFGLGNECHQLVQSGQSDVVRQKLIALRESAQLSVAQFKRLNGLEETGFVNSPAIITEEIDQNGNEFVFKYERPTGSPNTEWSVPTQDHNIYYKVQLDEIHNKFFFDVYKTYPERQLPQNIIQVALVIGPQGAQDTLVCGTSAFPTREMSFYQQFIDNLWAPSRQRKLRRSQGGHGRSKRR